MIAAARRAVPFTPALAGLLLLAGAAWCLTTSSPGPGARWLGLGSLGIAAGCQVLARLQPGPAPLAMLLASALGMLAGLAVDGQAGRIAGMLSICGAWDAGYGTLLWLHLQRLPAAHLGMVLGGLATLPAWCPGTAGGWRRRSAQAAANLLASGWMLLGMTAGTCVYRQLGVWVGPPGATALLGGMLAGMAWGMAAAAGASRFLQLHPAAARRAHLLFPG